MSDSTPGSCLHAMPHLLEMKGIVKDFPGVRALDNVEFILHAGEIHALMGENGAGKSTLIKVLTGVYQRDAGEMFFEGKTIQPRTPTEAQSLGISTVYQEVNLIPYLSVAENISLGREPTRWGRIDWNTVRRRAEQLLERLDVEIDVTQPLNSYSVAIQQMVAIARALGIESRILVLDEPTSSLDAKEVGELFAALRTLKQQGLGIIFITHFIDQVYAIADRITILRNGKNVGSSAAAALPRLELISRMIGKQIGAVEQLESRAHKQMKAGDRKTVLSVRGLRKEGLVGPLQFDIVEGESLGLAGLLGSGRTEAARLLFGIVRPEHGEITVDGRPVRFSEPRTAIHRGIGFCPEDRKTEGIIPTLSVRENILLALQCRRGWFRRVGRKSQQQIAERFVKSLAIATNDVEKPVGQLSGGTQQKVILARWLAVEPRLLILDEPTRGIDVGAKAEVEKIVQQLCDRGMAIVFISSEMEEVTRNSHRVVVLRDRHQIALLQDEQISVSSIMETIAHGKDSC